MPKSWQFWDNPENKDNLDNTNPDNLDNAHPTLDAQSDAIAANTVDTLDWKVLSPEVDGYTAQVALYLIENGRAEEVARSFDKYPHLSDEIVFKMIDAIDETVEENTMHISSDILANYEKYKRRINNIKYLKVYGFIKPGTEELIAEELPNLSGLSHKVKQRLIETWYTTEVAANPQSFVDKPTRSPENELYLQDAPAKWKERFDDFTEEQQKQLKEKIEFFPDKVTIITTLKIEWVEKKVKLHIDNTDVAATEEQAEKTDNIEIIAGTTYVTWEGAKSLVPENLHLKGSMFVAIGNALPYDTPIKMKERSPVLKAVADLLNITDDIASPTHKWRKIKWETWVKKDKEPWRLMTMGAGPSGDPTIIKLHINDAEIYNVSERNTMAPTRKLSQPVEILE